MCGSLETLVVIFAPVSDNDAKEEEEDDDDISLNDIIIILNEPPHYWWTLYGVYSDFINPDAFQAKQRNNPDVLSCS